MKTILVPVEHNDLIESSLATACLLAKRFDSYLEGFALNPQVNVMMAPEAVGGVVLYPTDMLHQDQEAIAEESHRLFESAMSAHQMTRQTDPESNSGFAWNSRNPSGNDYLGGYGRVFDITVLGRPSTALTGPRMSTLEAALFETGRPILIAPPQAPERIGEVVTISWNGSTEVGARHRLRHADPQARQPHPGADRRRHGRTGSDRRGGRASSQAQRNRCRTR